MEIIYRHKETGIKVSHKQLKEEKYEFINFGCHRGYDELITSNSYKYYEIPFSNDFETICVGTEFTEEELHLMMFALKMNNVRDDELYNKIRNMWANKLKAR